ncbi:hypothetical protein W02_06310 [Nitrospira sp. KM1]|uniref:UvrD-helicase domain-containing protein n=1 Tax=Nitrospira sp. KM1 TaxID=1936990 RepID=UPI0013A77C9C|nr:UvrD-helicase domain-containing protein [Nitrospira sp. KM1]BCA53491.1 hypothetical protein W02_06310 [Nitrospira sp. KM1]
MRDAETVSDLVQRELAETTFERNVIVVAGAGTGKTTLLVNRMVHLLVKEPAPVAVTEIVALTFTNKAAAEMKLRLRERLTALIKQARGDAGSVSDGGAVAVPALCAHYNISRDTVATRAQSALDDLEKSQIGTLHSFAAHLLRLYPLEARLDPSFEEDDGSRFEEHFARAWDVWIDRELSREGRHHTLWREILRIADLEEIRNIARALAGDLVDLEAIKAQLMRDKPGPAERGWLVETRDRAAALLDRHDRPKRKKIEHMLAAAVAVLSAYGQEGSNAIDKISTTDLEWLEKDPGGTIVGWEKSEIKEASQYIGIAVQLLYVNDAFFKKLINLLASIIQDIRTSFTAQGRISFDGLLAGARSLLRDHPGVREQIKQAYRAVLVDEFQDTDPIQYEIILAVSERLGRHASTWHETTLEDGKLFIVGDPKQSIYAFRRADIEAFDRVVRKIESQQGMIHTLTTNFRSDAAVLEPVNDVFDRLFERRPHVQPSNVRLEVCRARRSPAVDPGVHLRVVSPDADAEAYGGQEATRAESEMLARWLKEDLFGRPGVKPGHVAFLFRKLTQADAYLEALQRHGIPYLIEGEKHFYRRQEVIDLINILRVLDNPHDSVAMAGILRSPLGGLTDRELFDLRERRLFTYLAPDRLTQWDHPRKDQIADLFKQLAYLHHEIAAFPLADAIQLVFDRLCMLELAAASIHGEQAVANLVKIKQTAAGLSDRPHMTLGGFVELMVSRLDERPDEAESPLAEESHDAIHILTIHKAKGLEFPVVVLPGLHQGSGGERSVPPVSYDWSTGLYGLSLGSHRTLGAVLVQEKAAIREEAERRRVLYVGMTRAKDMLVLSGGKTARAVGESVIELLRAIGEGDIGDPSTAAFTVGASAIPHVVVRGTVRKRQRRESGIVSDIPAIDPAGMASLWEERTGRWKAAQQRPRHVTPTGMSRPESAVRSPRMASSRAARDREQNRLVGILAHRILQRWEFAGGLEDMDVHMAAAQAILTAEQLPLVPSLTEEIRRMFAGFVQSEAYGRLRAATILGREIPFLMPWENGQVMEGVIDLIYRLDGRIWIADYKTDDVAGDEARERARQYEGQASIYRAAVERSLGESDAGFQFIFVRSGVTVDV